MTTRTSAKSLPESGPSIVRRDRRALVSHSREDSRASEARGEPFTIATWEPIDLSQALLVMGFPSIGLVGSIATSHLIKSLQLREVGSILSPVFPPTAVVRDGVCASPVRIYLGDLVCGPDGSCAQLSVVHSDIAPKPGSIAGLVQTLVSWANEHRARQIVCLEGLESDDLHSEEVRVFGAASDPSGLRLFERLGVTPLDNGLLTGIGGVALYVARATELPALCLLAATRKDFPDARGAARLLEVLQPLVPLVSIDERPLYVQAQILEATFREQIERSSRAAKGLSGQADMMFG